MYKLKCLLFILCLSSTQIIFADDTTTTTTSTTTTKTTTDTAATNIANQKAECDKNTAMEWSAKLNRCIGKQAAVDTRNEVKACDNLTDQTAREKCHMAIAEKNTGLSSDTSGLYQGKYGQSMMINGAYTIISLISMFAKDGQSSSCTSKKIFAVTSIAGLASDVFLKMKAKKKVKELEGKYKLDTTVNTSDAQVKALEYLKEEQQTVVEIASMEKKRNLLLTIGYAVSAGWAAYDMFANPSCYKGGDAGDNKTITADSSNR